MTAVPSSEGLLPDYMASRPRRQCFPYDILFGNTVFILLHVNSRRFISNYLSFRFSWNEHPESYIPWKFSSLISSRFWLKLLSRYGRAIAQAVIRRLHTAAAQVRAQVGLCGICGG
jgi:hypothetical protein